MERISVAAINKRTKSLTIEGVNEQYAGNYSCRASNLASATSYTAELVVIALNYGDSASVQCSVISGDMPIMIEWFFNGTPISQTAFADSVNIADFGKRTKALAIDGVDARYAGVFMCKATNQASTAYHSTELIVNGLCPLED
ncbi:hypothetical protein pipiens_000413, partial [Culex pipiens pipiens]